MAALLGNFQMLLALFVVFSILDFCPCFWWSKQLPELWDFYMTVWQETESNTVFTPLSTELLSSTAARKGVSE
jgi:hypothetical protein